MDTITHKETQTKIVEKQYNICVFDCYIYAKYNSYNSNVNAHIGVIFKDNFYYIIQWSEENGKLILETKKVKTATLNKIPFETFINTYKDWKFISREDFMNAYRKVLKNEMVIPNM